jgi:excisionase family DNA binding protein
VIYFAQRLNDQAIKIGTTQNLRQRLCHLGRQHGPLETLGVTTGGYKEESTIHRLFAHLALGQEWFTAGADLLGFIRENTVTPAKYLELHRPRRQGTARIEQHYKPGEAARLLGTSQEAIRALIYTGQLKAVKVDKIVRISASEIERLGVKVSYNEPND